jgi:hypothetical protein
MYFYKSSNPEHLQYKYSEVKIKKTPKTRCVVNAMNAPALSQSFKAMFDLFQFQGG